MSKAPPAYVYTGRQAVWPRAFLERRLTSDVQARPGRFDASGSFISIFSTASFIVSNRSRSATIKPWRCTTACCSLPLSADPVAIPTPRFSGSRAINSGVARTCALRYASLRRSSSSKLKRSRKEKARSYNLLAWMHSEYASIVAACFLGDFYSI